MLYAIRLKQNDRSKGKILYQRYVFPTGAVYIRYKRPDGTLMPGYFEKFGDTHFPPDRQQWPEFERWAMTQPRSAGVIRSVRGEARKARSQDTNGKFDNLPEYILSILNTTHQRAAFWSRQQRREPNISGNFIRDEEEWEEFVRHTMIEHARLMHRRHYPDRPLTNSGNPNLF